ncbi:hypothetical protein FCH00_012740 [Klebsiella pneumoniae]|uniref:hypothetical protein n=1 Tax=Enterobacteriaceae TaxID=543 RepID=UPI001141B171|nr:MULTISPECIES: hypothetical protein [Enterobacteriaceae]MDU9435374.1 hypothetical protein [Escherichia coli]TYY50770.1 hypothetical protein FCH00_012740 [Klebsiella pneumoniae]
MTGQTFFLGDLVHCYRHHGRCDGAKTVCGVDMRDGVTFYRVTPSDDPWYTAEQLTMAQRPPKEMSTCFQVGQRVHCYNIDDLYIGTKTVESIVVFDGEPHYYVTPTDTPWFSYRECSLKAVLDAIHPVAECENMIF